MDKLLYLLLILIFSVNSTFATINGKVDYQNPIDYTKLNKNELEVKAEKYYHIAINNKNLDNNMTSALNLYTILSNIEPYNITYAVRLGKLYDVIKKDKYAKGNYYHAMGLEPTSPIPYYYLADFYYDRNLYKKALKFYKLAYDNGYSTNYQVLYKIGDIYQKFGDTEKSLQYLNAALGVNFNTNLEEKIQQVKNDNSTNKEYYR